MSDIYLGTAMVGRTLNESWAVFVPFAIALIVSAIQESTGSAIPARTATGLLNLRPRCA